jgi:polyisoprenoid-binding protein YceI
MKTAACLLGLLLAAAVEGVPAADWKMDATGSRLAFVASFQRAAAPGVFREFNARIRFDPEKPADGRLDVTVRIASADMNSAEINSGIRAPEWFDLVRFPEAEFHATDIRRTDAGRYLARGVLSLKGVQRPVAVPFTWTGATDTATMDGELTLDRRLLGVGTGEWASGDVIGFEVKLQFTVKLRKAG